MSISSYRIIKESLDFFPMAEWLALSNNLAKWEYADFPFISTDFTGAHGNISGKLYFAHARYDGRCIRGAIRGELQTRCTALTSDLPDEERLRQLVLNAVRNNLSTISSKFSESPEVSAVMESLTTIIQHPPYVIFRPTEISTPEFEAWKEEGVSFSSIEGTCLYQKVIIIKEGVET